MGKPSAKKRDKVRAVVIELFEEAVGAPPEDLDFDMAALEEGSEALWAATQETFGLPDDWTGDGSAINGSLAEYIDEVARLWDGKTLVDRSGPSPLLAAAAEGDLARVRALIAAKGAKVDARDGRGWTALHHAVYGDDDAERAPIVRALLDAGADPKLETTERYSNRGDGIVPAGSPAWAIAHGESLRMMMPPGARDSRGNTLLIRLCMEKSVSNHWRIPQLDGLGIEINAVNEYGWTALHYACLEIAHRETIFALLERGADKTIRSTKAHKKHKAGSTPRDLLVGQGYQYADGRLAIRWEEWPDSPRGQQRKPRYYAVSPPESLLDPPVGGFPYTDDER